MDLATGDRTIISDLGDSAQGPLGFRPIGVTLDGTGDALVVDDDAGTNFRGALFSVNLATGDRTIISDFGDTAQGPRGIRPNGVTLDGRRDALVVDSDAEGPPNFPGALFRVDLATGDRTIISDFGDSAQGPLGRFPVGVTFIPFPTPTVVTPIPTLSEWGLITMAGILGIVGFMFIRRRKAIA